VANHKSAKKRNRQAIVARSRNRAAKSRVRTVIKALRIAIGTNDKAKAAELLLSTQSLLGRLSKSPAIKKSTAARKTSRLAAQVAKL
jgi:small subunit ribosomal protein S20